MSDILDRKTLLTDKDMQELLGKNAKQLAQMRYKRTIPFVKFPGEKAVYYRPADIKKWIDRAVVKEAA
ncbi:helix-turn-helix domain-containing protein [Pseudoclavibacter alba]|uniref:Helix-turn-helix domain-containing protein n=1 Tax=Pseudoclavibacter albus TaxID=272241 RepID=A0ABT2HWX9_9MICO|nr:helix-turn-helix domain-containing protein [Pseudoclavibacter alba]MCT2042645.1 helix-turn-helix domain-containing protein [Pseudoclavibacter alba]